MRSLLGIPDEVPRKRVNGGAERDRTVGLLNAIYFRAFPLFSSLLASVQSRLKISSTKLTLFNAVSNGFPSSGAQKLHRYVRERGGEMDISQCNGEISKMRRNRDYISNALNFSAESLVNSRAFLQSLIFSVHSFCSKGPSPERSSWLQSRKASMR